MRPNCQPVSRPGEANHLMSDYQHPGYRPLLVFLVSLFILCMGNIDADNFEALEFYRDARFSEIVTQLESKEYKTLDQEERLLLLASLARTARGYRALPLVEELLKKPDPKGEITATAALIFASIGRFTQAGEYIHQALQKNRKSFRALLTRVMIQLYGQKYNEAQKSFEDLATLTPSWANSNIYYFTGIEVYSAARNPGGLKAIYLEMVQKYRGNNRVSAQNLESNSRLFHKISKQQLYGLKTKSSKVVIPFSNPSQKGEKKEIILHLKKQGFRVVLDTGNAVGLMIHSRILKDLLKCRQGGRALSRIGSESSNLYSYRISCKKIDFQDFSLEYPVGQYVPKPRPEFYDANLNPLFIRNRIVTIDFINHQLILTTPAQFKKELLDRKNYKQITFPWYGYEHALIPATVNKRQGLLMIETGAEDIALKLDFARWAQLPLVQLKKYLSNGKAFFYHKTPVSVKVGSLEFERSAAEVWPLDRFHNPILGLTPDVVMGPEALDNTFIISFDPFNKKVILEQRLQ